MKTALTSLGVLSVMRAISPPNTVTKLPGQFHGAWSSRSGVNRIGRFIGWLNQWADYLELLDQIRRERRELAGLSDRDLQDIGVDRATAMVESSRTYFDVPSSARRRRE